MVTGVTALLGYNVTEIESFLNKLRPLIIILKNWTPANLKKMA